jgi:aminoglycoside 3-N-acetyltransferase
MRPAGIERQGAPPGLSTESLAEDLRALGIKPGEVLLVHTSMRRLGWVREGAAGVVAALRAVLGDAGTLVVPTFTANNSDSSRLHRTLTAGMTTAEVSRYRAEMPPFNPVTTPSASVGAVAEHVRRSPGAARSVHPQTSFAALGPLASTLMASHAQDCHFGERSPLARLYEERARVLLLGVGYQACSAFHLAEYRYVAQPPRRAYRCVISADNLPRWWEYQDVVLHDGDFGVMGEAFDRAGLALSGHVGDAECRLGPLTSAVDFAAEWLRQHRAPISSDGPAGQAVAVGARRPQ